MTRLDIEDVSIRLADSFLGNRLRHLVSLESTNVTARQALERGVDPPILVSTDFQTDGKGRRGRAWRAPRESSLLMSLVVPLPPGSFAGDLVHASALAASSTIGDITGLSTSIKWPNDVLINGRKSVGVLTETAVVDDHMCAIVGTGINVNFDPASVQGLPSSATSVSAELGAPISREDLLVAFIRSWERRYLRWIEDQDSLHEEWCAFLGTLRQWVTVYDDSGHWSGLAVGVERDGSLRVRDTTGRTRVVYAADVSIRAH
ncbi:MAG: biotin--[acetyl-CoA-carboxylase] ligase [Chloroflexota bacterium]|nr:MAG: biotin--[acetyl-CoA-carboxylase] ligase [Chloroflexota bacterium]